MGPRRFGWVRYSWLLAYSTHEQAAVTGQLPGMTPQSGQGAHFAPQLIGTPAHPHHTATIKASVSGLPGKQTEACMHPPTHPCPDPPTPSPYYPCPSSPKKSGCAKRFCPDCTSVSCGVDVAWQCTTQQGQSVTYICGSTKSQYHSSNDAMRMPGIERSVARNLETRFMDTL